MKLSSILRAILISLSLLTFSSVLNAQRKSLISTEETSAKKAPAKQAESVSEDIKITAAPQIAIPKEEIYSGSDFTLRWEPIEEAVRYETQIALDKDFTKRSVTSVSQQPASTMAKDVKTPTVYFIRARGANNNWTGPWSEAKQVTILPPTKDMLPKEAPVVKLAKKQVKSLEQFLINWAGIKGSTSYELQMSPDASFPEDDNLMTAGLPNPEYMFCKKCTGNPKRYYIRVRAQNNSGYGPWSKTVTITVNPER